jgi:hypothetical protein
MENTEFDKYVNLCKQGEKANSWDFGDNLLTDYGDPPSADDSNLNVTMTDLSKYLEDLGYPTSIATISQRWNTCYRFPANRRHDNVSFSGHQKAGDPETLDRIVALAASSNEKVTISFIEGFLAREEQGGDKARQETDEELTRPDEDEPESLLGRKKKRGVKLTVEQRLARLNASMAKLNKEVNDGLTMEVLTEASPEALATFQENLDELNINTRKTIGRLAPYTVKKDQAAE